MKEGLLHVGDVNTVLSIHSITFLINVFSMSLRVEKHHVEGYYEINHVRCFNHTMVYI